MFDKKEYWKRRNNVEEVKDKDGKVTKVAKPLRGQKNLVARPKVITTSGAEMSFDSEGGIIVKNRAYRRKPIRLPSLVKKVVKRKLEEHKKAQATNKRREHRQERLGKV